MFGTHDIALFIATALVLNATPGVDLLFTLTKTLQGGWRTGIAAALGISSGCIVHSLAAALGLAALLATSAWAFSVVKWIGGAYLLWLAWGMLRSAATDGGSARKTSTPGTVASVSARTIFWQGFLTNVLNPKVALFFLALLPQFIDADAPNKLAAFLFLGAIFVVNGTIFLIALVTLAQRLRRFGGSSRARRIANAVGGALFVALAVRLVQAER